MADRPRIVIIGAGASGRGHIGQLAHEAGFALTFIERRKDLVDILCDANLYTVCLAGADMRRFVVRHFNTLHTSETDACAAAIACADIVATAVIPTNLESTVPTLAAGLAIRSLGVRKPLNIIACENMERSSTTLRSYLKKGAPDLDWSYIDSHVGFPDSMIARVVPAPEGDELTLLAEANQEWTVDLRGIMEPMPRLAGMTLAENQDAALERKLYIKNTGHMAIGVLGFLKGYQLMDEAARDPEIFAAVDAATKESAAAVVAKHGFPAAETEQYRAAFLEGMKSPYLPDPVSRVIREPIRKLSREERLVGPAMLACDYGIAPTALAGIIAATMTIDNPDDPQSIELRSAIAEEGVESVIESVCGIPKNHLLGLLIGGN